MDNPTHVNGIWWHRAPLPPRWHACRVWTSGTVDDIGVVERCACGAARRHGERGWLDRNSRRRDEGEGE